MSGAKRSLLTIANGTLLILTHKETIKMLIQETFIWQGRSLVKSYSDSGFLIRQLETGNLYEEAVDPLDANRQYEETDIYPESDEITDAEALAIITEGESNASI